jgi:WD40 repeat protein
LIEPLINFTAHTGRITQVQYHPTVSDIIVSASPEQGTPTLKVWNLSAQSCLATFEHPDKIVSIAIHPTLERVASLCRDGSICVFEMRTKKHINIFAAHLGGKSGRILWLGEEDAILSVGFSK